jgi:hypothetical protein
LLVVAMAYASLLDRSYWNTSVRPISLRNSSISDIVTV